MTQVPILSGTVAGRRAEYRVSFPVNLEPMVVDNGVSGLQLSTAPGVAPLATGPGPDRGAICWNGTLFRVMGSRLVSVTPDGQITDLGDVGNDGTPAGFDYGFDRIAIRSAGLLFYWNGVTLAQVTDPDLGPVSDMLWVDGYFMTTDGTSIVVTDLADPTSVNPLKYGSAEADPDMITGLIKLRDEVYALGRHTIQVFQNTGGNGFPFQAVRGATIPYGCIGPAAKSLFSDTFAFVGSSRGEPLGVYVAGQGTALKISTKELDDALANEPDQAGIILENRSGNNQQRLLVHLSGETWTLPLDTASGLQKASWYILRSRGGRYRPRRAVLAYGKRIAGDDTGLLGVMDELRTDHWGEEPGWQFDAGPVYLKGRGGILHRVELVGLPGYAATDRTLFFSVARDGQTWSNPAARTVRAHDRVQRPSWAPHFRFTAPLTLRVAGDGPAAWAALDLDVEPLA